MLAGRDEITMLLHPNPDSDAIDPAVVVDHYPSRRTGEEFTDVRPEYRVCATILVEYLDELEKA